LRHSDIDTFCVATIEEGVNLRRTVAKKAKILILGYVDEEYFKDIIEIINTIHIYNNLAFKFNKYLKHLGIKYDICLKIDTGMNRLGFKDNFDISDFLSQFRNLNPVIVMSHLSSSDTDEAYTNLQIDRFKTISDKIKQVIPEVKTSLFNSQAIVSFNNTFDITRPGIMSYGYISSNNDIGIKPVMKIFSRIVHIKQLDKNEFVSYSKKYNTYRKTRVGVLPIGYADGYNRLLSNKGYVYIGNYRCPVIGTVCMDMIMIDITDVPEGILDSEVEILGDNVRADELAKIINTISYEILTNISNRIPRIYVGKDE